MWVEYGLLAVWIVKLIGLLIQVDGLNCVAPVNARLNAARRDIRSWFRRFMLFPTLCWWSIVGVWNLCCLGIVAAILGLFVAPSWRPISFALVWASFLSLSTALPEFIGWYPWDLMMLESAFVGCLFHLPVTVRLWAYRWLLFRIMFGFGKLKYGGFPPNMRAWLTQLDWPKKYLATQPMPTPLAFFLHKMPVWPYHAVPYIGMFFIEYCLPFTFLVGLWPNLNFVCICLLMAAIQAGGNYGEFNIGVVALALCLLDDATPVWPPFHEAPFSVTTLLVLGLLNLPSDSLHQGAWMLKVRHVTGNAPFYLLPWRFVNSYGVFTPRIPAPLEDGKRRVAMLEGSVDGVEWRHISWRFACGGAAPSFLAPYHPRIDHQSFYEQSLFRYWDLFLWDPYSPQPNPWIKRLGYCLMQKSCPSALKRLVNFPFSNEQLPKFMRVRRMIYRFAPQSSREYYTVEEDLSSGSSAESIAPFSWPSDAAVDPFEIPKPDVLWFLSDNKFTPWSQLFDSASKPDTRDIQEPNQGAGPAKARRLLGLK